MTLAKAVPLSLASAIVLFTLMLPACEKRPEEKPFARWEVVRILQGRDLLISRLFRELGEVRAEVQALKSPPTSKKKRPNG